MAGHHIFVSVGATSTPQQEQFVQAIEDRLRSEGFTPHTVGRNTFSADAPLRAVVDLISRCSGAVVIALERSYFPSGISKRGGPDEKPLSTVRLPTPWNQIEAAMSYHHGLPLMVIVESGLRNEGLLEQGYDWFVQEVSPEPTALVSPQFNGVLGSWKEKVESFSSPAVTPAPSAAPAAVNDMTISQLVGSLKPGQLWSVLAALAALVAGAFAAGAKLAGGH